MKKIVLLSIALITAGFLSAPAQNKQLNRPNVRLEYSEFEKLKLSMPTKIKSGQDWWEPDTIYYFFDVERCRDIFEYRYHSQELLLTNINQRQVNNSWENSSSVIYTYDSNNNLLTKLYQEWKNNSWENIKLNTYTYDSNSNLLTGLQQSWKNDSWVNIDQTTRTYDSYNNVLTSSREVWEDNLWKYISIIRYDYTYDSNNNYLTILTEYKSDNIWINSFLQTYTYDSNNNILTYLYQSWETKSSLWINTFFYSYTYDSNNNVLTELAYLNTNNISWDNPSNTEYTYDSNNNLQTKLYQEWRNNSWENIRLDTYTYDSNNNLLTRLQQIWKDNLWINSTQNNMIYDENMNCISAESLIWQNDNWQPWNNISSYKTLSIYYNNMQSVLEMMEYEKITASYIKLSDLTSIAAPPVTQESNAISIYPNPTMGELKIKSDELRIENVELFDVRGKKLSTLNSQLSTHTFDISHLPAGMYFVIVTTDKGVTAKKVAKK